MARTLTLRVRASQSAPWLQVFTQGGWKVKGPDGRWIQLGPNNTLVRDDTNTGYYTPK